MQVASPNTHLSPAAASSIYVVDDDEDLRRSLHFLLQTKDIWVSSYSSGASFLDQLSSLPPAPIILDLRMPQMEGNQVLVELTRRQIRWPVIMLTGHGEVGIAVESLKSGAFDFLEKPVDADDLLKAVDAAFARLAAQLETDVVREEAEERLASLTPREIEVLDHLCAGRSTKQLAFDLSISPRTVEMHRANALRQLGVRTLVEAAAIRTSAQRGPGNSQDRPGGTTTENCVF